MPLTTRVIQMRQLPTSTQKLGRQTPPYFAQGILEIIPKP